MAEAGAAVAINYRERADHAKNLADELLKTGVSAIAVQADVSQSDAVAKMIQELPGADKCSEYKTREFISSKQTAEAEAKSLLSELPEMPKAEANIVKMEVESNVKPETPELDDVVIE